MTKFATALAADRKPPRIATLCPDAFADDWAGKPEAEVAIGLRFISVEDLDVSENVATRRARDWMSEQGVPVEARAFEECRNNQLIMMLVSRAATDVNDISVPYFGVGSEDIIRQALTPDGARRLWDELQFLHAGSGVAMPVAGDEEVQKLVRLLRRGKALGSAKPSVVIEARKMVGYLLEQLGPSDPEAMTEAEDTVESSDDEDYPDASDEGEFAVYDVAQEDAKLDEGS